MEKGSEIADDPNVTRSTSPDRVEGVRGSAVRWRPNAPIPMHDDAGQPNCPDVVRAGSEGRARKSLKTRSYRAFAGFGTGFPTVTPVFTTRKRTRGYDGPMVRSPWHSLAVGTAVVGLTCAAGCSLLAPSDDEAMAGLASSADGGRGEGGDAGTGRADGAREGGSAVCPACPLACNQGQCSACYLSGAPCTSAAECCGGVCNAGNTCGNSAGACTADNEACTSTPDSCCPGTTCSVERGNRCNACTALDDNCKADTDCCSVRCGTDGRCKACLTSGATGCSRPRECCSGVCNAGMCG